jgi:hypothetical protein
LAGADSLLLNDGCKLVGKSDVELMMTVQKTKKSGKEVGVTISNGKKNLGCVT